MAPRTERRPHARPGLGNRESDETFIGGEQLPEVPCVSAILADRGYRGLASLAARRQVKLEIKAPPKGIRGFAPIKPLVRVEHAFTRLGRWRGLSRCYEETTGSVRAWLEVASMAYLFARLRAEST